MLARAVAPASAGKLRSTGRIAKPESRQSLRSVELNGSEQRIGHLRVAQGRKAI